MITLRRAFLIFSIALLPVTGFAQEGKNNPDQVLHNPPTPEFSFINLCYGDTTLFINQTISGVWFMWRVYGPGQTILDSSTAQDLSYYFPNPGTYTVELTADNGHLATTSKVVQVGNTTLADFSFQECSNKFVNMAACATGFFWDFGDGTTSTDSLPIHSYADTGFYQVKLIANKGAAYDTITKLIKVDVLGFPDAAFTLIQSDDTLFFQLNNYIPYSFISWTFGDGSTDSVPQSFHIYQTSGTYYVSVLVKNECGMSIYGENNVVSVPVSVYPHFAETNGVSIYPNPAVSFVTVSATGGTIENVIVTNCLGDILSVSKTVKGGDLILDISSLASGIYYLQVLTDTGFVTKKIIKPGIERF